MRQSQMLLFGCLLLPLAVPSSAKLAGPLDRDVVTLIGADDPSFFSGGVIIARNGRTIASQSGGYADFARQTPIRRESVFQLASASKPFTSVAVLQLRDRGRLRLDDPVAKYLKGFPYPRISIRHLLTHTSGLPDLELFEPLIAKEPNHVVTGRDLVPALIAWQKPVRFHPGEEFRYSNINYQLLAELVAEVSGKPFPAYVRDNVFRPAGMRSSYVIGAAALGPL